MCELLCTAFPKSVFEAVTPRVRHLLHSQSSLEAQVWEAIYP